MKELTIVALGALALGGCTGTRIKPPAICDGKHRRPANLYGSILPSLPVPMPASQQGSGQSTVVPPEGGASSASPPAPAPSADGASAAPAEPGAMNMPQSAPRLSRQHAALSYSSCRRDRPHGHGEG